MVDFEISTIIDFINQKYPSDAVEVSDILELLVAELEEILSNINTDIIDHNKDKEFDKSNKLQGLYVSVSDIQDLVKECLILIIENNEIEKECEEEPADKTESSNNDNSNEEKVGKYVRNVMRYLSNNKQEFSDIEIQAMLSKEWSKEVLDLDFPLLKEYQINIDVSEQAKEGPYRRYWIELFEFKGKKYMVTSQWFERNREPFKQWVQGFLE